jgi:hypothetical protein
MLQSRQFEGLMFMELMVRLILFELLKFVKAIFMLNFNYFIMSMSNEF